MYLFAPALQTYRCVYTYLARLILQHRFYFRYINLFDKTMKLINVECNGNNNNHCDKIMVNKRIILVGYINYLINENLSVTSLPTKILYLMFRFSYALSIISIKFKSGHLYNFDDSLNLYFIFHCGCSCISLISPCGTSVTKIE